MSMPSPTHQAFDFEFVPALKLFMENMEVWKKNYEQVLKGANIASAAGSELPVNPAEQAIGAWSSAGEALFTSFVEQQIELCRFYGKRWETYLDHPRRLSRCKNPADAIELQMEFVKKMAEDYTHETMTLTKRANDFTAACAGGRFAR